MWGLIIFGVVWVLCGILAYGMVLADCESEFGFAIFMLILGIIGLIIVFFTFLADGDIFGNGLRFRRSKEWKARYERQADKYKRRVKELETFLDRLGIEKP